MRIGTNSIKASTLADVSRINAGNNRSSQGRTSFKIEFLPADVNGDGLKSSTLWAIKPLPRTTLLQPARARKNSPEGSRYVMPNSDAYIDAASPWSQ